MTKNWVLLLGAGLLSACASAPITQYYRLADVTPTATPTSTKLPAILVDIKVADFLSAGGIAYQQGDVELRLAQQNLWAERLPEGVKRVLIARMQQQAPNKLWLDSAPNGRISTLSVELTQFNGRDDGQAILAGHWFLRNAQQTLILQAPFHIELAQQGKGYPALVVALGQGLDRLGQEISQKLAECTAKGDC
ncbi:ABC-type transport auxiliary lipoprotein family protein [Iodobacter sp. CM08]|uniref:PqiC family protein n=1 Tax=Iodobacter sp. CM08 TaxID=3085902 RepID=UPI0029820CA9|nr:ABC-type transport auxiliary lipoprotein family protein [Iodobacter sp. CM08]MDW5418869.1 ABC-type transport auxiliary lipoprotein family protein [Iodobacter sp. CM08]